MIEKTKQVIAGIAMGVIVGIAAGYGVAKVTNSRSSSAPTDVKTAWEEYVRAQRNYMSVLTAQRGKPAFREVTIKPLTSETFQIQRVMPTHPEIKGDVLPAGCQRITSSVATPTTVVTMVMGMPRRA